MQAAGVVRHLRTDTA